MQDDQRLDLPGWAKKIAKALHEALSFGVLTKIGIEDIRASVVGYLAATDTVLSKRELADLIEATLRKTVEMVG